MANSLKQGINRLQDIKKNFNNLGDIVAEEIAKQTSEKLQENYDNKGFSSSTDRPAMIGYEKQSDKYVVYARSKGVAYEEFGTGDMGELYEHQSKDKYQSKLGLLRYNLDHLAENGDGSIYPDTEEGGYYWIYDGQKQKGIPSGNFMFKSWDWLQDNYEEIINKKVDDVLSKH